MSIYTDEPFFKLQHRVLDSSVWDEDPWTRIVFVTLLALAQKPENRKHGIGVVAITDSQLSRKANVPPERLAESLKKLMSPDPRSRTEPSERLEATLNGYRIVNFGLYHNVEDFEEYRERRAEEVRARQVAAGKARAAHAKRDNGRFTPEDEPEPASQKPNKHQMSPARTPAECQVSQVSQPREREREQELELERDQERENGSTDTEGQAGARLTPGDDPNFIPTSLVLQAQAAFPADQQHGNGHGQPGRDTVLALLRQIEPATRSAFVNGLQAFRERHPFSTELRRIVCDQDQIDRCVALGRRERQAQEQRPDAEARH